MKINNQRGFVIPLIITIFALLALGGGVFVYKNTTIQAPLIINTNLPVVNQASTTTSQNNIVSIVNEAKKCGYEIKVPEDFFVFKNKNIDGFFEYNTKDIKYADYAIENGPYTYTIDSNGKQVQNIIKNALISGAELSIKFEVNEETEKLLQKLNNEYSYAGDLFGKTENLGNGVTKFSAAGTFESIYMTKNTYLINNKCSVHIAINYNYYSDKNSSLYDGQYSNLVNSIITTSTSTKKTVLTIDETKDWKTYTNAEYGIDFIYPSSWQIEEIGNGSASVLNPAAQGKQDTGQPSEGIGFGVGKNTCVDSDWNIGYGLVYYKTVCIKSIQAVQVDMLAFSNETKSLEDKILASFVVKPITLSCTPKWTCGWAPCVSGYQGMMATDTNNCGLSSAGVNIACPAIARECVSTEQSSATILPIIESITPNFGPKGTEVQIKGKNLSGFEGDLIANFERADGKVIILTYNFADYPKTGDTLIKVKVAEPCQPGERVVGAYSGIERICDYTEMTPGVYKVYASPWGNKSNIVNFTITK